MRGEGQTRPNPFAAALACILAVLVTGFASRDKASSSPSAATQSDGDIVFSVFEDMPAANCGGLFAVDPGTRKVQALAGFGPSGPLLQPAFSPDGRTLTVTALNGSSSRDETVFRYEQESGKVVRHASKSSLPSVPPVWSRQSDAFLVLRRGSLHAVDLARHDHELLRGSASPALGYSWSPDEKKIAYTRSPVRRPSAIWIVGRDGANPRLFIRGANDPAWLLDGSRMIVWANAELQSPAQIGRASCRERV